MFNNKKIADLQKQKQHLGLQSFKFAQLAFMPFGAEIAHKIKDRYI